MNAKKTNETLFLQAKELRMCDKVHKAWYGRELSVDELFDLYYQNLDFCTDNRWPSNEEAKELFTREELRSHGVVIDETWSLLNPTHSIYLGSAQGCIRYNSFCVGRTTIMGSSSCDISVKGHAIVTIHVYDKANIRVFVEKNAKVIIIKHSTLCTTTVIGKATIKDCT